MTQTAFTTIQKSPGVMVKRPIPHQQHRQEIIARVREAQGSLHLAFVGLQKYARAVDKKLKPMELDAVEELYKAKTALQMAELCLTS